jgi:glycosyltransferase involved in cell wall biosynthesis
VKFSILLPTRNRLELLRYAVESVRRQDYADWELVIADNASEDDIGAYVAGLCDARIRYQRSPQFLPVTDNWNRALAQSTGDFVLMLGDDDSLLPGSLGKVAALLDRHAAPEVVYVEAVQFAYPGVIPGNPGAFVQTGYCEFMRRDGEPFLLAPAAARAAVDRSMALRLAFSFNMQHSFVSRAAIDRLAPHGPFYQSPYPDYYATTVLLLTSRSVLVVPEPLVAIGISPRSFGYYHFNEREAEGTALLNNLGAASIPERLRGALLPGNVLLTCWFLAMAAIEQNFGGEYGVRADRARYRYLQILPFGSQAGLRRLLRQFPGLTVGEMLRFGPVCAMLYLAPRVLRSRGARFRDDLLSRESPFPRFDARKRTVEFRNILELFNDWERIRGA